MNDKDVTQLVESITWGGDTREVSRKLEFNLANKPTDYHLPKVNITVGDKVTFKDDNKEILFFGIVFDVSQSYSNNTVTYLAYDLMFYISKSEISHIYDNKTAENIVKEVCSELGITVGELASTNIPMYLPVMGKKGYEVIMMAYTYASRKNGKKYIPLMNIDKVTVIEKGTLSGVMLKGDYNLVDQTYKVSLQNLANKILIVNDTGKVIDTIEDKESRSKYGTVQLVYKKEDNTDYKKEANNMIVGIENEGSVSALSDTRAVSGYAILVYEQNSKKYGKFYIESDTHTFVGGKATMELTLAFELMMDEKEIEEIKKSKKSKKNEKSKKSEVK